MVPRPYPDELIGSVVTRAVIHSGLPPKKVLAKISVASLSNLSFFLPSQLSRIAELTRIDGDELLWNHTAFPYVVSFMPLEAVRRLRSKVLGSGSDSQTSLSSLTKSVTQGLPALRLCSSCVLDDQRRFGESYWHRMHCLPALHVCHLHGQPLRQSLISSRHANRSYGRGLPQHQSGAPVGPSPKREIADELASVTCEAIRRRSGHHATWAAEYRDMALTKGFSVADGSVAGTQLSTELARWYGSAYLTEVGASVAPGKAAWPSLIVRPGTDAPFAPVKHVLVQAFLNQASSGKKQLQYRAPGPRSVVGPTLDSKLAKQVRAAALRAEVLKARVSVAELLMRTGRGSMYRHSPTDFPLTSAAVADFKCSDAAERQTGGERLAVPS